MGSYRILMFTPYYPPHVGGVEFYSKELIEKLTNSGHKIILTTSDISFKDSNIPENILIYPTNEVINNFPLPKFWTKEFQVFLKNLDSRTYDIVIGHTRFFPSSLFALLYSKKRKIPYLHIEHGSSFVMSGNILIRLTAWIYDQIIGKYIIKQAASVIAISQAVSYFLKKFIPHKEVTLIYRGIKEVSTHESLLPFIINTDKPVILFIGRIVFSKGIRELLTSLENCKNLPWNCYIAGDGPDREVFNEMINKSSISDRINLLGYVDPSHIPLIISKANIFAHPSYTEGLPTTVLEAALAGIPIIATDVGGTKEISEAIHLIAPKDTQALSREIENILKKLPSEEEKSQILAPKIRVRFSWEESIKKFEKVFSTLASK